MSQIVDRRNLDFLLYEFLSLEKLLEHPRFGAHDREAISGILDTVQRIAETELLPCAAELDAHEPEFVDGRVQTRPVAKRALDACAAAGLFCVAAPADWGGLQMPATIALIVNGMLASANLGLANYPSSPSPRPTCWKRLGRMLRRLLFSLPCFRDAGLEPCACPRLTQALPCPISAPAPNLLERQSTA
jgi:butyryl-CoA dehydrogenase